MDAGAIRGDRSWFDEARFGMFVHWDHASQRGWELSWPMVGGVFSLPRAGSVGAADYHALATTFDPVDYDANEIARLAVAAGMRYVVFTTRHHSGFAMFRTATTEHSIDATPSGRDLVRETADAVRAAGLRVGFYYSLSDWHHPDYPAWRDEMRPYRLGHSPPMPSEDQAARFRAHLLAQLEELVTGYGRVDVLWFDGGWERPSAWWPGEQIVDLLARTQPGILVNDRLPGYGDFLTPEQFVPAVAPTQRWETCLTMNDSWGWNPSDTNWKTSRALVHTLCETAGRGGNLLLNISPTGVGAVPAEQRERLADLSRWMERNATAIHGTDAGLEPWQFYGPSTRRGDRICLFLLMRPYETVTVRGMPVRRVRRVAALGTGNELAFTTRTGIVESLMPDPDGDLVITVPESELDELATVLTVDVDPRVA